MLLESVNISSFGMFELPQFTVAIFTQLPPELSKTILKLAYLRAITGCIPWSS